MSTYQLVREHENGAVSVYYALYYNLVTAEAKAKELEKDSAVKVTVEVFNE